MQTTHKLNHSLFIFVLTILFFIAAFPLVQAQTAAPGDLDTTFGNGGKVVTRITGQEDYPTRVRIQPDGKIVTVGNVADDAYGCPVNSFLVRHNADGRDDLIVTRTEPNGNLTHYVGDASSGASVLTVQWGNNSGVPTAVFFGDYTGDNRADIAVNYGACNANPTCDTAGTWWILPTGTANYTITKFGIPRNTQNNTGDFPVFGDWDGDGKTDISVFRFSNTTLYALTSSNGQLFSQFWNGDSATP